MGGIPAGGITEIVGPAGLGKTQFCLGMCGVGCLQRIEDEGRVLYIDTERKFNGERLAQIFTERFTESLPNVDAVLTVLDRVIINSPSSSRQLMELLDNLQSAIIDHNIKLIIIDSIAALVRADFGGGSSIGSFGTTTTNSGVSTSATAPSVMAARQQMLGQQASRLKFLADTFRIPILVTNQVTTSFHALNGDGTDSTNTSTNGSLTAALGPMWAHAVNTRLVMSSYQDGTSTNAEAIRTITIAKSPSAPCVRVQYRVTSKGVEWVSGVEVPPPQPGSVIDMAIANYQGF